MRGRKRLLAWYDANARALPWRESRDPYAIWVSEIMLQQTRVDTVIPYYQRFLAAFPTPKALASASEDAVLAAWSGLGYYRRARHLHAGVREVMARYGGEVPREAAARLALPGIGRYTAGAIGSIAFDFEEPILDGNVARVLARVHGIATPLDRAATKRVLWERAASWARGPRPGALNQALMELGALVCRVGDPDCDSCPLAPDCHARRTHTAAILPVAAKKRPPQAMALVTLVATDDRRSTARPSRRKPDNRRAEEPGRLWLRRATDGLFGGLYCLPTAEGCGLGIARGVLATLGLGAEAAPRPLGTIEHILTHRRLQVDVFRVHDARPVAGAAMAVGLRSFAFRDLDTIGLSRLTTRILELAQL